MGENQVVTLIFSYTEMKKEIGPILYSVLH